MDNKIIDPIASFQNEILDNVDSYNKCMEWKSLSSEWLRWAFKKRYMYNFKICGRPVIQTPVDIVAMQEIIWDVRPDLIIETGIAHGGSLILSASMLALLDYCESITAGKTINPKDSKRQIIGIDIEIREHNRKAIEAHPLSNMIDMIQGSSIESRIIAQVHKKAKVYNKILVCLDSNHTHEHVLAELEAYAPLTSVGSYCVVFDTIIEDLPDGTFPDRPWSRGNNPKTAVWEYLRRLGNMERKGVDGQQLRFEIDKRLEKKLMITVAPDGYLKRIAV